ncbi:MAG: hypothetical protein AAB817_00160 [Patescibacteria group bacterium]
MKQSSRGRGGYTLIELIITVVFLFLVVGVVIYGGLITGVAMGNFWVGEGSAPKAVQLVDPTATKVLQLERNVWAYSKVTVDTSAGRRTHQLDADVLQNVAVVPDGN